MKQILDIDNTTLVEECKGGDREAMSLLYTRLAPRMLHVISRYVSNQEDAYDILHDGFIAAFTRLGSLRDPERLEYWLATIMKNLSLKFLQSQNVETILDEIPEEIEENSDIDEIIDFSTLESLIAQLPDGYQKVFRLAVLENKSHKEISKILGIAPNSSSSQLFHAKVMLRRLIADHKNKAALVTLLLMISILSGVLFVIRNDNKVDVDEMLLSQVDSSRTIAIEETELNNQDEQDIDKVGNSAGSQSQPAKNMSTARFIATLIAEEDSIDDGKKESESEGNDVEKTSNPDATYKDMLAEVSSEEVMEVGIPYGKPSKHYGWSAGVSFETGMLAFEGLRDTDLFFGNAGQPGQTTNNPDDSQTSPEESAGNTSMQTRSRENDQIDQLKNWTRKHYLPITVGFTVEKRFSSWAAVESGLAYSYLHSDYEGYYRYATCHWHYLEIPLKFNVYAYQADKFALYGSMAGRVSIPVYSNAVVHSKENSVQFNVGSLNPKPVWSVGVGIGFSFNLSKRFNVYLEPSLQYHLPQETKVPNVWTDDECWSLSIPIGVRFRW